MLKLRNVPESSLSIEGFTCRADRLPIACELGLPQTIREFCDETQGVLKIILCILKYRIWRRKDGFESRPATASV